MTIIKRRYNMVYKHITELIGNTPLILLDKKVHGLKNIDIYAKLEFYNPFGSVKDRIAWGMIKDDINDIQKKNQTLIEASSGNTAKALQGIASTYGLTLKVLTNRVKVPEVKDILELLGTDIEEFPGLSECPDPTTPNDVFSTIQKLVEANPDRYFHPSQYTNQKNIDTHYQTTGKEIYEDIGKVDYLFGGLGTTGSTRGTALYLKEKNPELKTMGIVASKTDFIPGIRSISEMWDVGLFDKEFYEEIMTVESSDAIEATMELIKRYGVLAGPTSGAAYFAATEYLRRVDKTLKTKKQAVFIVCDRVEWYLSYFQKRRPDLFNQTQEDSIRSLTESEITHAKEITIEEVDDYRKQNTLLIDIRGNMAYRIGHIPGSINIRDDQLEDMVGKNMPFPKNMKLLFLCPIGEQSRKYVAFLQKKGYVAASLTGGITAWRDAGYTLERISKL